MSGDSEAIHAFKRLLADRLDAAQLPIHDAAAKLNISSERLYKYLNAGIPNSLPAYLLPLWTRMIGPELLQALAHEAHYAIAELPRVLPDWKDGVQLAARITRECGEILTIFAKSIEDEEVTARELREIERAVQHGIAS